jgi:hypothetical protein
VHPPLHPTRQQRPVVLIPMWRYARCRLAAARYRDFQAVRPWATLTALQQGDVATLASTVGLQGDLHPGAFTQGSVNIDAEHGAASAHVDEVTAQMLEREAREQAQLIAFDEIKQRIAGETVRPFVVEFLKFHCRKVLIAAYIEGGPLAVRSCHD